MRKFHKLISHLVIEVREKDLIQWFAVWKKIVQDNEIFLLHKHTYSYILYPTIK